MKSLGATNGSNHARKLRGTEEVEDFSIDFLQRNYSTNRKLLEQNHWIICMSCWINIWCISLARNPVTLKFLRGTTLLLLEGSRLQFRSESWFLVDVTSFAFKRTGERYCSKKLSALFNATWFPITWIIEWVNCILQLHCICYET